MSKILYQFISFYHGSLSLPEVSSAADHPAWPSSCFRQTTHITNDIIRLRCIMPLMYKVLRLLQISPCSYTEARGVAEERSDLIDVLLQVTLPLTKTIICRSSSSAYNPYITLVLYEMLCYIHTSIQCLYVLYLALLRDHSLLVFGLVTLACAAVVFFMVKGNIYD